MSTPRVSVVIPLYDHARYVELAIRSALDQTLVPVEVIVIDDGSRDDGPTIVRQIARREPRIIHWSQPNQDAYFALNAGIHRATGDLVAILNSDDAYEPSRLEQCTKLLLRKPSVSAVATALQFMDEEGREIPFEWYDQARLFYDRTGDLALALVNGNFLMTTSNLVVRRSTFKEIGGFARLRYAHDLDFMLRLLAAGRSIEVLDEPLLRYRIHPRNTIKEEHRKVRVEWAAAVAAFVHCHLSAREDVDWHFLKQLYDIIEKHALSRNMLYLLTHFARTGERPARADSFVRDPAFRKFLDAHSS